MRDKDYLLGKSKYFCMSAWTHLHALPDGNVITCCLSPMDQPVGNTSQESLDAIWNGERMRLLRANMLADQPTPEICSRCYQKEADGLSSLRHGMNIHYGEKFFNDVVETTRVDGHVDAFNLVHWDFRFSNICNLKCRTCGPGFSSSWNDDFKSLHNPDMSKADFQRNMPKFQRMIRNEDSFWKVMTPLFDTVEVIHFAGGEPLIMDEHYRILRELIARQQYDVHIRYSTNLTELTFKGESVLQMWEGFKNIDLSLSIDGFGPRFDYIRSGGTWQQTLDNLEALKQANQDGKLKGVRWFYHPTISIMNVFHVLDLHRFLLEEGHIVPERFFERAAHYHGDFILNPVIYPDHYNIQALPETLKTRVREAYRDHATWAYENFGFPKEDLLSVVAHMDREDKSEHFATFIDITTRLDDIRREDFVKTFPELSDLMTKRWNHCG